MLARTETITDGPFAGLPRGCFGAIAADPGTKFETYSAKGESSRTPQKKYTTLPDDEIAALPVGDLGARDSHLFYWDTGARIAAGRHIPIMRAWGYEPTAIAFTWLKLRPREPDGAFLYPRDSLNFGPGLTTRKGTELCILGRRGSPRRLRADIREVIIAPRREHSRKPDEAYARIQQYCVGPYLELFARTQRQGWAVWGDQVGKFK